ncbi:MAG: bifunctional phosphoribosylaminoimidazolecarboxamide formyltransferase/IMP cyclohydrolase [Sphingobacteriales bacterium]|nr:MAG: bifunctional phosphoribosylaminoimidazolecarboxamide formyltransferase/IMP cyclohydrolase [Sphingobacteriales bacterium]
MKKIKSALISVYYKDGLDELIHTLAKQNTIFYSTGGTQKFIESLGYNVIPVENYTGFPEILDGRVKTLHPKIFGGILARRSFEKDIAQLNEHQISEIDLVIVDLYPFEETVKNTNDEAEIIKKIDIGGISLIRAAAKNYNDTTIIAQKNQYNILNQFLLKNDGSTSLEFRRELATQAFAVSSHYDTLIYKYLSNNSIDKSFKVSSLNNEVLRYGENPHQKGYFYGNLHEIFDILNGKTLSYNNLVDVDAAIRLISEFNEPTFAILKHTNACGVASRNTVVEAWKAALAGDPVSAFGGVLICNERIDLETATEIDKLFFEVLIAPSFDDDALEILCKKKNRIILKQKLFSFPDIQYKSLLNGTIVQDFDTNIVQKQALNVITKLAPNDNEIEDLLFANKIVKHLKSNTIVLAKNKQLLGMGCGQTSRVDALQQAILKANCFNFNLEGSVMASDAFFPFPDCVEIANNAGIKSVLQPGGSIKDQASVEYCDANNMAMVMTGMRHFKH